MDWNSIHMTVSIVKIICKYKMRIIVTTILCTKMRRHIRFSMIFMLCVTYLFMLLSFYHTFMFLVFLFLCSQVVNKKVFTICKLEHSIWVADFYQKNLYFSWSTDILIYFDVSQSLIRYLHFYKVLHNIIGSGAGFLTVELIEAQWQSRP